MVKVEVGGLTSSKKPTLNTFKNSIGCLLHSPFMDYLTKLIFSYRIMDSIEECGRSGNPEVVAAAVECVVSLLDALEKLCTTPTDYILPETAGLILEYWPKLHDADYTGPLTYQTLARLPSPYRY